MGILAGSYGLRSTLHEAHYPEAHKRPSAHCYRDNGAAAVVRQPSILDSETGDLQKVAEVDSHE